jgi:Domain of unknown function (DUF3883)
MSTSESWSREEVEIAVADYLNMLSKELRGEAFNKAEHNRGLQQLLPKRTRGSVERKHQNISAVLLELGYPYIDGYKPLRNYQELLREAVEVRLVGATILDQAVASLVESPVVEAPIVADILAIKVEPPEIDRDEAKAFNEEPRSRAFSSPRNYLEIEARNRSLGRAGEQLVLRFEHERLWRARRKSLADRIEYVAESRGDQFGYDILSFEIDGRERLIEVKTTRFGPMTPFFASRNEVNVSQRHDADYQLYRLFRFSERPKLFTLSGSLTRTCRLDPVSFSAIPGG